MPLRISLLQELEEQENETYQICFSPDGNILWSSDGAAIYQWQRNSKDAWNYSRRITRAGFYLQCTADSKEIAFQDEEKRIHFYSLEGCELMILSHPDQGGGDFALSPDQRSVVVDGRDGKILLWKRLKREWSSLAVPDQRDTSDGTASCFQFTPNGLELVFVASNYEGQVHICHFDPDHEHYALRRILPVFGVQQMKISPDGKWLAITHIGINSASGVSVYDLEWLQLRQTLPAPIGTHYDLLVFSPDSRFLMSSRSEGFIDIWSLTTFERVASLEAHQGPTSDMSHWTETIGGLDWSATGSIATGGTGIWRDDMMRADYSIRVWKAEE